MPFKYSPPRRRFSQRPPCPSSHIYRVSWNADLAKGMQYCPKCGGRRKIVRRAKPRAAQVRTQARRRRAQVKAQARRRREERQQIERIMALVRKALAGEGLLILSPDTISYVEYQSGDMQRMPTVRERRQRGS